VRQVLYVMKFSGQATFAMGGQQQISLKTTGLSNTITTRVTDDGVEGTLAATTDGAAFLESTVTMSSANAFTQEGTISFGDDHEISFVTVGTGLFGPSADPQHFHGSVTWRVTGGSGTLEGATGYVTSNFTISDQGEVADYQLGVLFVP